MSEFGEIGIFVLVVVAVIIALVGVVYSIRAERERRAALARLAAEHGWRFCPEHDRGFDERYRHFACFRVGHSRSAFNVLRGGHRAANMALDLEMGDFRYQVTTSNGKTTQTTTYYLSFLIAQLPWPNLPPMSIAPEHFYHRFAQALGFDDIDFESEEFSRRFLVKGGDRRLVYDVIDPRMIEFLMQSNPPPITIDHGQVLLVKDRGRWSVPEFSWHLQWLDAFVGHWPRHVVDALDGRG